MSRADASPASDAVPSPRRLPRFRWDELSLGLFLIAALLVAATFRQYGVTWDEDALSRYGALNLAYYVSGFRDTRALSWPDLVNYGGLFDMAAAALNRISPLGEFETRHFLNGLVGVLGLVGSWRLAREVAGPRAGFIAALLLLLMPNYYGQMFNNPKDIPFAVGMTWSLYLILRLLPDLPRPGWRAVVPLGLAAGLAMAVRVGGLMLFGYAGLALLLSALWRGAEAGSWRRFLEEGLLGLAFVWLPALAIAYAVMLLFWPWAQAAPIAHPLRALAAFSHQYFPYRTLFAGAYIPANELPWFYLPVSVVVKVPELVLLLLAAAPALAIAALRRSPWPLDRARTIAGFMLGFTILFPVGYAIAIRAVLFDGMRHFLFILPPIACAAAVVADWALDCVERWPWRRYAYGALALYGAYHVGVMALLHPDEYVYYNLLVGGVPGASGRFKLDYWANSYAEDVRGLERYLRAEYGAAFASRDFTVAVCGPARSASYYFPRNFVYAPNRDRAQFFIAFTKNHCDKSVAGTMIYRVRRMHTLLSAVIDRRAVLARATHLAVHP